MIFKRPKTSNNFWFYYSGIHIEDEGTEQKSTEEEFDIEWNNAFENQIYFWYLMQIFDLYDSKSEEPLWLWDIWEVEWYKKIVDADDANLWNENSLWDFFPYQDTYCLLLYRIVELTRLFFAFDIKRLSINGYPDQISKDFLKSYQFDRESEKISDEDCEYIYHFLWELWKIDSYLSWRKIIKLMNPRDFEEERAFSSDRDNLELYPNPEVEFHWREARWEKAGEFWKYMQVEFEFHSWNMKKLYDYTESYMSDTFDGAYWIENITRQFIALAKRSEIIWNTVFIKFADAINADFPCLQYIYWLNKTDWALIASWKIKDAFMISLFDPTICHILGIGSNTPKQQSNIGKLSFNEQKEVLELNGKKLWLWPNNEGFIKEYFDLIFEFETGVFIDSIVERLEPNLWELEPENIPKRKKSLSYDRVNLLNKKIAKLTWITGLFKIENWYIKLTSEIRVEK